MPMLGEQTKRKPSSVTYVTMMAFLFSCLFSDKYKKELLPHGNSPSISNLKNLSKKY
jgi:hypothetical protein